MKLGSRIVYENQGQRVRGTIIGELEREFVIRTDDVIRERSLADWSYHVRIPKHQVDQYLTLDETE